MEYQDLIDECERMAAKLEQHPTALNKRYAKLYAKKAREAKKLMQAHNRDLRAMLKAEGVEANERRKLRTHSLIVIGAEYFKHFKSYDKDEAVARFKRWLQYEQDEAAKVTD